jgi:ubiquinone/menaquinone biosynthesis C-methylase UbiE
MTQNIYDDEKFFTGYSRLLRSVEGLDGAPEWPALRALLPDIRGRNVLDLGCGFGWFCRWACQQGAAHVLGIDVSEKMLVQAKETTDAPSITYIQADKEHLELQPKSFDVVYSSLALHYVENLNELMSQTHRSLVPGGHLVFSVEHPIFTAPSQPSWSHDTAGRKSWRVVSYLDEGPRSTDWLARGVIKQHRTLATYINMLIKIGFVISHVEEWGPTEEQIAEEPNWADERQRPPFLIVAAAR